MEIVVHSLSRYTDACFALKGDHYDDDSDYERRKERKRKSEKEHKHHKSSKHRHDREHDKVRVLLGFVML